MLAQIFIPKYLQGESTLNLNRFNGMLYRHLRQSLTAQAGFDPAYPSAV